MAKSDPKPTGIVNVNQTKQHSESSVLESESGGGESPARARYILVGQSPGWHGTAVTWIFFLLLTTIALSTYVFYEMSVHSDRTVTALQRFERQFQQLSAGISFDSQRQQLLLGVRDEIMRSNPQISLSDAYAYAQLIVRASEKYPSVSPLMLLAVGIVESRFDPKAVSQANARGLYQIWPSTGRMLAGVLGWEYSDEMLFDPERNTEMAALYLDILYSAYNDPQLVLAEYNGGPLNAGYLRARADRIAAETRDYVPKVLDVYHRLERHFEQGVEVRLQFIHRDRSRGGKTLWVASDEAGESPTQSASSAP